MSTVNTLVPRETFALVPDETDEALGIEELTAIVFERAVLVIVRGDDGMMSSGRHCPWPTSRFIEEDSIRKAKRHARFKLMENRSRRGDAEMRRLETAE